MPEVGVLNLTIQDNSTEAAGGLSELTGALVGLQNALGQGLKLSGVSKPLNTFANAVKENSKTFANVGSFLNAMSTYKKAFDEADKVRFNAQPIRDLKDAIGDGIRLGQAGTQIKNIREALTGEWNTDNAYKAGQALAAIGEGAKSIPSGLEKKADGISKVAAALQEYADASERIKSVVGSGPVSALNDSMGKMSVGGRSFGLQFFGGTGGGDNAINEMHSYAETIHSAADEAKDFNVQLHETKDVVESIRVNPFEDMYQSFSRMAHEFDWFKKESMRLMSGDSPLLLGDGRTPGQLLLGDGSEPQTFLSVWRDTGEQWKQNWVEFSSDAANEMRSQWKPDWIVGEGTVSAAKEVVNEIKEGAQATQAMATAARDYNSEIGKVHNYFKGLSLEDIYNGTRENAMGKRSLMSEWLHGEGTETEQAYAIKQVANQLGMSVDEVKKQIDIWNGVTANINTIDLSQYMDMSQTDLLTMKMQGMEDALMRDVQAGKLDQQQIAERAMAIQNLRDKIQELTDAQNEASGGTVTFGGALKSLQAGVNAMFPTLTSMIKRLGTIAKYRFIRSVIKHITSGFSEGIQNVYEYSKAVGGSFAPAMDSAATAIAQMKNSLGAALAPAIQALIPILNTVVNWFITLVNYANQFFALLNGQATWTRALPATVNAFDKQKKAAKGAGNAIKDLLADWDELNIIQSEAGGGGGVGSAKTAEDYLKMFEEVGTFENKVKDVVNFAKNNFEDILTTVLGIKGAMMAWRFSKAVMDTLPILGKIAGGFAVGSTIAVTMALTDLTGKEYVNTTNPAWLIADGLTGAVGATIAGKLATKIAGSGAGMVSAGFTLLLSGGVNIVNAMDAAKREKDAQAWMLGALGSIEAGIGTGLGLAGLGLTTPVAIAGGVITAGIAMLLVASVILDKKPQAIKWGDYQATAEEIKAFVKEKVFVVSADTILNVIDPVVKVKTEKQEELQASVDEINLDVKKIKLGINEEDTLADINKKVFGDSDSGETGIIGKFKETAKAIETVIETGITIVPGATVDDEGNVKGIIEKTGEGWKLLTGHMDDLGADLSHHLAESYKENLTADEKAMELKSITEITQMIANVSSAIIRGQEREKALQGLEENLSNLTPETMGGLFDYINEYKQTIVDAYTKAYDEVTQSLAGEAAGLQQAMEDELFLSGGVETAKYKQYKDEYDYIRGLIDSRREGRKAAIDREMDKAMDEDTIKRIREALIGNLNYDAIGIQNVVSAFRQAGIEMNSSGALQQFLDEFFNDDGTVNDYAAKKYDIFIDELLRSVYGDSYDIMKAAMDTGIFSIGDLLPGEIISNIIRGFVDYPFDQNASDELSKFISGQFTLKGNEDVIDNITKESKDVTKEIQDAYHNALSEGIEKNTYEEDQLLNDLIGKYGMSEVENALNLDTPVVVDVTDVNVNVNTDGIDDDIREQIEKALQDGNIDVSERNFLDNMFGADTVEQALEKYANYLNNSGSSAVNMPSASAMASIPTVPVATTGPFLNGTETVKTEPADPTQDAANVETGVRKGNSDLVGLMRDLIDVTRASNNRPINVTVSPSSGWGFHNVASGAAIAAIMGVEV